MLQKDPWAGEKSWPPCKVCFKKKGGKSHAPPSACPWKVYRARGAKTRVTQSPSLKPQWGGRVFAGWEKVTKRGKDLIKGKEGRKPSLEKKKKRKSRIPAEEGDV